MFLIPRKIIYYTTSNGVTPFIEWLDTLDQETTSIIYERIEKVKIGYFGDYKNLGNGVFELRIHLGLGYRIYFGQNGKEIVLILCGGNKNTQERNIKKAKIYWEKYKNE